MKALAEEALPYARTAGHEVLIADALAIRAVNSPISDVEAQVAEIGALYRKVGDIHGIAGLYSYAGYVAIAQGRYEHAAVFLDQTLELAERSGEPFRVILAFGNLGLASLFTGDLENARAHFGDELRLCREHAVHWMAAEGLAGLGAVAACRNEAERAARLLGAAESLAQVLSDPVGAKLEQQFFAPARERIGEERWRAAYADGARLGFEDAVSLALSRG